IIWLALHWRATAPYQAVNRSSYCCSTTWAKPSYPGSSFPPTSGRTLHSYFLPLFIGSSFSAHFLSHLVFSQEKGGHAAPPYVDGQEPGRGPGEPVRGLPAPTYKAVSRSAHRRASRRR